MANVNGLVQVASHDLHHLVEARKVKLTPLAIHKHGQCHGRQVTDRHLYCKDPPPTIIDPSRRAHAVYAQSGTSSGDEYWTISVQRFDP